MIPQKVKFPDFWFWLFSGVFGPGRGHFQNLALLGSKKPPKKCQNRKSGNLTLWGIIKPTYIPKIRQKCAFFTKKYNFSAIFWLLFWLFLTLFFKYSVDENLTGKIKKFGWTPPPLALTIQNFTYIKFCEWNKKFRVFSVH